MKLADFGLPKKLKEYGDRACLDKENNLAAKYLRLLIQWMAEIVRMHNVSTELIDIHF